MVPEILKLALGSASVTSYCSADARLFAESGGFPAESSEAGVFSLCAFLWKALDGEKLLKTLYFRTTFSLWTPNL